MRDLPQPGQKARRRQDDPHVRGHRLDDDRCHLARMSVEERGDRIEAVVGGDERLRRDRRSDSGAAWDRERGDTRAGFHQQRVGMTVVAALELDHEFAAGGGAGYPQRAHRSLRAAVDEPQPLDRRHSFTDQLREANLGRAGSSERTACLDGVPKASQPAHARRQCRFSSHALQPALVFSGLRGHDALRLVDVSARNRLAVHVQVVDAEEAAVQPRPHCGRHRGWGRDVRDRR